MLDGETSQASSSLLDTNAPLQHPTNISTPSTGKSIPALKRQSRDEVSVKQPKKRKERKDEKLIGMVDKIIDKLCPDIVEQPQRNVISEAIAIFNRDHKHLYVNDNKTLVLIKTMLAKQENANLFVDIFDDTEQRQEYLNQFINNC